MLAFGGQAFGRAGQMGYASFRCGGERPEDNRPL